MSLDIELKFSDGTVVHTANISHDLAAMATEAGLYECVWRPEEHGFRTAAQVAVPLAEGLQQLAFDPARFKAMEPPSGGGRWRHLLPFCAEYLEACRRHPDAKVVVCR